MPKLPRNTQRSPHLLNYYRDKYGIEKPAFESKMGACQKCGQEATIRSIKNGELEYQLCSKCFAKRCKTGLKESLNLNGGK